MSLQNLHQRLGKNLVWIVVMNTILSLIATATTSATLGFVVYERVMRDYAAAQVRATIDQVFTPQPGPIKTFDEILKEGEERDARERQAAPQ